MAGIDHSARTTLGHVLGEYGHRWVRVVEARYGPGEVHAKHSHRYPAVTVVLDGGFDLWIGGKTIGCSRGGMFFRLGDHSHSNVAGSGGGRSFIIEFRTDDFRIAGDLVLPRESHWSTHPAGIRVAGELVREFRERSSASSMAIEGLALELLAVLVRSEDGACSWDRRPGWVDEVESLLRESCEVVSLQQISGVVGRHPAHVARVFRRSYGCSIVEYSRRIRVGRAARLLRETELSLVEIAIDEGFCDQSHFSRCFKAVMGISPGKYRAAHRS